MPSSARHRGRAAVLAAALVLVMTVGLAGPAQVSAQPATPTPAGPAGGAAPVSPSPEPVRDRCLSGSTESPVRVEVTTLAPRAPSRLDEPFQVAGRLTNCGREPLRSLQVRLSVGERIGTRTGLQLAAEEPVVGDRRLTGQPAARLELAPGASTTFDVRALVGDLQLGRGNGVYPLAVQARAQVGDALLRESVGLASTFLPWFPEGPVSPTRLAWLTPLVDQPHRGPGAAMLDDALGALLADGGRLQRALAAGQTGARGACDGRARPPAGTRVPRPPARCRGEAVPMTYALDPDLVFSVEAMTRPYRVLQGRRAVPRRPLPEAERWLTALRSAARQGDVLALPYGDPDVVALSRPDSGVKNDVEQLSRLGSAEARRLLGVEPLTSVAWPPAGPVTPVVDPLAAGADTALLLEESALTPGEARDRTPSARTTLPSTLDPVTALVADQALSRLVEPDPSAPDWQGPRLAEQRWIAESAVIAAERPGQSRTLVVTPRRRASLLPAVAAAVIADTGRLPWLCPVRLVDAAAGTERCATLPDPQAPAAVEEREPLRERGPGDAELPPQLVRDLGAVQRDSDQFTEQVLLAGRDSAKDTKVRLLRARARAESSAWRQRPAGGRRLLRLLQDDLRSLRGKITLVATPVLLTGRSGTVQLTVQNGLDQPVNVGVALDPNSAARLTSEDTELQVVPPREARQVSVRVEARTSGRFTVLAGLVDAGGRPFGRRVELQVRSTEYGRVALGVTGAAAAVLLLAAGTRLARRALRRDAGPAPDGPSATGPPEPAGPGSGV